MPTLLDVLSESVNPDYAQIKQFTGLEAQLIGLPELDLYLNKIQIPRIKIVLELSTTENHFHYTTIL